MLKNGEVAQSNATDQVGLARRHAFHLVIMNMIMKLDIKGFVIHLLTYTTY